MSQNYNKQSQNAENQMSKVPAETRKGIRISTGVMVIITVIAVILIFQGCSSSSSSDENARNTNSAVAKDSDLVIPVSEISANAKFYPVEINGTRLEVIAVKAPDGTIRTAFNTCQVCYDSGRGYYKQDRNVLVCQNCGNRFRMDQVEVQSGGCNPVPILPENKNVSDETITISNEFLAEAKVIFANWKTAY
ncbi:MAG: DUF2318 domain-containing protein [Syntrophomonadaceae bacterium]|jgi:uncharacterized membrane protein|nr:DUF2318 domain-containing protein [Syntrophomonadaceae bacterium]